VRWDVRFSQIFILAIIALWAVALWQRFVR